MHACRNMRTAMAINASHFEDAVSQKTLPPRGLASVGAEPTPPERAQTFAYARVQEGPLCIANRPIQRKLISRTRHWCRLSYVIPSFTKSTRPGHDVSNIHLSDAQHLSTYRKISIASWQHPRDPSTYSILDIPIDCTLAYLEGIRSTPKPTLTQFTAMALAHCLEVYPQLNHVLRRGKLYRRKTVDAFITTLIRAERGKDLSGFVVRNLPSKSLIEFADVCESEARRLWKNKNMDIQRAQHAVGKMSMPMLRAFLALQDLFLYRLNIALTKLSIPRDAFGSFMVSNIGALGIENALIPLSPYCRCPLILGVGKPYIAPIVRDDAVVVGKVVTVTVTFDHRYADGAHTGLMLRRFKKLFSNPEAYSDVFKGSEKDSP